MNDVVNLIFSDERSQKILRDAMERLDMSAEGTIRYFCRMGQLVDERIHQGYKLGWIKNGEVVNPDDVEPKMAPADLNRWSDEGGAPPAQLSCGCDVGCCICDYEKD